MLDSPLSAALAACALASMLTWLYRCQSYFSNVGKCVYRVRNTPRSMHCRHLYQNYRHLSDLGVPIAPGVPWGVHRFNAREGLSGYLKK